MKFRVFLLPSNQSVGFPDPEENYPAWESPSDCKFVTRRLLYFVVLNPKKKSVTVPVKVSIFIPLSRVHLVRPGLRHILLELWSCLWLWWLLLLSLQIAVHCRRWHPGFCVSCFSDRLMGYDAWNGKLLKRNWVQVAIPNPPGAPQPHPGLGIIPVGQTESI